MNTSSCRAPSIRRAILGALLACAALLALQAAPASATVMPAATGSINGTATGTGGAPLEGICVVANPAAGGAPSFGQSSPDGTYSVTNLADGQYKVSFSECSSSTPTYAETWYHDKTDQASADSVAVTSGGATNGVNQQLAVGATISGRVTDNAGTPNNLPGICVFAERASGGFGPPAATARTAADGTYTLRALPAGSYKVHFDPSSTCSGDPDEQPQNYLEQYYDGKADAASATTVPLAAGGAKTGADAKLVPGATISGTVRDSAGTPQPVQNVCVQLVDSGEEFNTVATATTDAAGHYSLVGLPAGSYKLDFASCGGTGPNVLEEWWNDQPDFGSATVITLTSGQAVGSTDAQLAPGASISGHVTDSAGTPNDLSGICVTAYKATAGAGGDPQQLDSTVTDGDGNYTISSLPAGDYKVKFDSCGGGFFGGPPSGNWVTEWWNDKSTFAGADQFHLTGGALHANTDAAMAPGSTISGHVKNSDNEPLSEICVGVAPFNGSQNDFFGPDAHFTQTDSNGSYSLSGLAPGDYKVGFQDCFGGTYVTQFYANKPDFASATKVTTVVGTPQTNIDATLTVPGSITGHVENASHQSVDNECVDAFSASTNNGPGMFTPVASDSTGLTGDYEIAGLAPGEYKVRFHDCGTDTGYASQTYNGQPDLTSATHVTVTGGNTTPHVDATLAPGATIAGQVNSSGGRGISGVCVAAYSASTGDLLDGGTTGSDGSYALPGLRAGTYKVQFTTAADCPFSHRSFGSKWFDQKDSSAAADTVTVTAGDFHENVNAVLTSSGASISGHVTAANGGAALAHMCVSAQNAAGEDFDDPFAETETNASGDYVLEGLTAGSYKLRFDDCSDGDTYRSQYFDNAPDFPSATAVAVSGTTDHPGVNAALVAGGRITGHVSDTSNANVGDVCVEALRLVGGVYQNERGDSTASNGDYTIGGLPAGTYKVRFSDCELSRYTDQWWHNQPDLAHADAISISAGATSTGISATMALDPNGPPETTIGSGPAQDTSTASTTAHFAFSSSKANSTFQCRLDNDAFALCSSPKDYSGLAAGTHHFQVRAIDSASHVDPTPASRDWTVNSGATSEATSGSAPAGGTVSSNPAATDPSSSNQDPVTASSPVAVGVTSPSGGSVTIVQEPASSTPSPTGFTGIGNKQITITAPTATVASPLKLVFVIDASAIPAGTDKSKLTVVRSGTEPATDCIGSTSASPDPCVTERTILSSGDVRLVVLAVHTSPWTFAQKVPPTDGGNAGGNTGGSNTGGTNTGGSTTGGGPTTPPVTPSAAKCKVPNLKGKTLAQAKKLLKTAHCKLGKVSKKKAPKKAKVKKGRIFKQSPAAGAKKPAGTKVSVVVAK